MDPQEREEEQAVLDTVMERVHEHDAERESKHKQDMIAKHTRDAGLDEG